MPPLWQCSAHQLRALYERREASPVEALQSVLDRMDAVHPRLNAFVAQDRQAAMAAARASERRWHEARPLSPLDGVPLSVKDNIAQQGLPATWGSAPFRDYLPERDETPVARLREAGVVFLGKTNVPEFTLHGFTGNALFGVTRNPWNPALTPGGSSGGAVAAVAAGMGPLALGTDGGGSIRRPAGYTGLVGLKPTAGRVPRRHGLPAILLDFEVIGPLARTVADLRPVMALIAPGFAWRDQAPRQRILRVRAIGGSPVDPVIDAALDTVVLRLQRLGHEVTELDDLPLADAVNREVWPFIGPSGLAWLLRRFADGSERIGAAVRPLAQAGQALLAADLFQALDRAAELRQALADLQQHGQLLLTPTAAAMPWVADRTHPERIAGQAVGPRGHAVFTAFVNATGVPAIALPAPRSPEGLPIGFQLVGGAGDDELLCALAQEYETAHPWAQDRPPLD